MSKEDEKQEKARTWRVGIVAPGCSPNFAVGQRPIPEDEVVAAVGEYSETMPDCCVAFAFRSRSESFDERCAALASLFAVHVGKGEFAADDVAGVFGGQVADLKARLEERARTCTDLRGDVERWRSSARRGWFVAWLFFCLFTGAALTTCARGALREQPALDQQDDQRGENGHEKPVAARSEAGENLALLPGALLGVEGFETGVRELAERDAGRNGLEGANDIPPDELCVNERGGNLEDGGIGVVGIGAFAGLRPEDAVFDVVHAAESSTGTDKLSVGTKRTE